MSEADVKPPLLPLGVVVLGGSVNGVGIVVGEVCAWAGLFGRVCGTAYDAQLINNNHYIFLCFACSHGKSMLSKFLTDNAS
jgi:hypothetical protein